MYDSKVIVLHLHLVWCDTTVVNRGTWRSKKNLIRFIVDYPYWTDILIKEKNKKENKKKLACLRDMNLLD